MTSIRLANNRTFLSLLLAICLLLMSAAPNALGQRRHHHSKTKGALVGGAIGAVGGALVGGGKGAVIGGAAGAGTGALVQHARNVRHRHHRSYQR